MSIILTKNIENKTYFIRDKKVMIDGDLSELYQVETKQLKRQVRRNIDRFPDDFMFEFTIKEFENLKSQIVTSSWGRFRIAPMVFTEQGISMLSSVINSTRAIQVNIQIIRLFTKMREMILSHQEILKELENIKKTVGSNTNDLELALNYLKQFENAKKQEVKQAQRDKIGYKKQMKNQFYILFFLLIPFISNGQQQNLPLNREFGLVNQKVFNDFGSNVHTSFLPLRNSFVKNLSPSVLSKSEEQYYLINISKSEKKPHNFFGWMWRSFAYENLLIVDTGNFYLTVDPLLNIELGSDSKDQSGNSLSKNTRGAIVRANVGDKFSFETVLYENQMFLPQYQTDYVKATGVVSGQGRVKNFKGNGFDFAASSANLSYTPNKHLNFQLGTGKNFVGDGYRSLLLSDASFNYPFWKIIGTFGANNQFQYTKLNASLSSITRRDPGSTGEALFERKTMSTHYFSWLATKWLNVGLFESTMWQTEDSTRTKPLQWQQFNPVIGVNALTTGFNDVNHTVIGTNIKIKLPFNALVYNQFVYDGESKYGYQIGAKYFGIPNLTLQAEFNNVEPYTYTSDLPLQAYSNYNEAIAHPSGANFNEIVGIVNYKYKRVFTQFKVNLITSNLRGSSVFASENEITPAVVTDIERRLTILQAHVGFIINPKNNMSLTIGINKRKETLASNITNETNYVYFGFRTALRNLYSDF